MPSTRDLDPRFQSEADDLIALAQELDPAFRLTSGRRTRAEQTRLWNAFQLGESDLPAAVPGTSQHERGLAVDIARPQVRPRDDDLLYALGKAWHDAGGKWAGDDDPVHFEWSGLEDGATAPTESYPGEATDMEARRGEVSRVWDFLTSWL